MASGGRMGGTVARIMSIMNKTKSEKTGDKLKEGERVRVVEQSKWPIFVRVGEVR